jgi:hypothetical protein
VRIAPIKVSALFVTIVGHYFCFLNIRAFRHFVSDTVLIDFMEEVSLNKNFRLRFFPVVQKVRIAMNMPVF